MNILPYDRWYELSFEEKQIEAAEKAMFMEHDFEFTKWMKQEYEEYVKNSKAEGRRYKRRRYYDLLLAIILGFIILLSYVLKFFFILSVLILIIESFEYIGVVEYSYLFKFVLLMGAILVADSIVDLLTKKP